MVVENKSFYSTPRAAPTCSGPDQAANHTVSVTIGANTCSKMSLNSENSPESSEGMMLFTAQPIPITRCVRACVPYNFSDAVCGRCVCLPVLECFVHSKSWLILN